MKFLFPLFLLVTLTACNTVENRRSLYSNQKVHGPYTRGLEEGTWSNPKNVSDEYAETQTQKRYPKVVPGEKAPATSDSSYSTPGTELPSSR